MPSMLHALSTVVLLVAVAERPQDAKEVGAALKKLNDAFAADDASVVRSLMTVDHVAVTPYAGRQTLEDLVKHLPDGKFTEYTPGPMTYTSLADGAMLVTYTLAQKGTFRGKPVPTKVFSSAVWVKRDGAWKEAYYQETAAD